MSRRTKSDTKPPAAQRIEPPVPGEARASASAALLQSWIDEEDAEEQWETGEYLIRTLDEDRFSSRKLFPKELKGITW